MLNRLRSLFARPAPPAPRDEIDIAIAALLVEAAIADETYSDREKAMIDRALAERFGLDRAGAASLRGAGEAAQESANDLHRFTRRAKELAPELKIQLVETLWRIVLSDGARDPHEDALIRRVCGLIYVSDPDSGAARRRAAASLAG